jgi:hypothetical protein
VGPQFNNLGRLIKGRNVGLENRRSNSHLKRNEVSSHGIRWHSRQAQMVSNSERVTADLALARCRRKHPRADFVDFS